MSIASALFSESQSRVLRWVFGQPDREFHLNELRRRTGLGSASLQRELNRLAEAGLVLSGKVGNLRRFRANPQSPVYNELIALTRKTLGAAPLLREALLPLTPGLRAAWIYGSYAKESDTAQSDVDVMLVGTKLTLSRVVEALEPVEAQLARTVNPTLYTPTEFAKRRAEKDSFVNRVLSQSVIPLIGEA
jgi:predicted nucleotidyltransferase